METNKIYTVTLEEDPETGDLILPFPVELLNSVGWSEGTILEWEDMHNGSYMLHKVDNELQKDLDSC